MAEINAATSYKEATGRIAYGLTNDYMFKIVLESNIEILKALICALLHLSITDIISIDIRNPIIPGKSIGEKNFILDIKIVLNNNTVIDIEMQLNNLGNWIDRSLNYLCRLYNNLSPGQDYTETMSAIHIGFLDFTLFEDNPEFYATYRMMNTKNFNIYSDKFTLSVVDLNKTELATDEDKAYGIDQWAKLFKATTWEELKTMATQNPVFEDVAKSMFMYSSDKDVLEQCYKVEYNQRFVNHLNDENKSLKASNDKLKASNDELKVSNDELKASNDELKADNADKDNRIAELQSEIAYLKAHQNNNN
jgi:predicted transposase/invertase (TIGR01784 family)